MFCWKQHRRSSCLHLISALVWFEEAHQRPKLAKTNSHTNAWCHMHWDALQSSLHCPESSHLSGFMFRNPLQVTGVRGRSHFPSFHNRFLQTNNYIADPCTSRVWRFQSLAQCMQRGICTVCARNVTIRRCSLANSPLPTPNRTERKPVAKFILKRNLPRKDFSSKVCELTRPLRWKLKISPGLPIFSPHSRWNYLLDSHASNI